MQQNELLHLEEQVEILKAVADPVRLDLLRRIAKVPEMACTTLLEETHVAPSTVSYHVKLLRTAGLIAVRKEGRNFHYTYRPEPMASLTSTLSALRD